MSLSSRSNEGDGHLSQQTVLLVGGTGRTGKRVLEQLLRRGIGVRVVVRSAAKLPPEQLRNPCMAVVEANLLSLSDADLARHVQGCAAVISCLGHVLDLKGVFGPPRDLVTRATMRLCRAIEAQQAKHSIRLILMTSVSVNHPGRVDTQRGGLERVFLWMLRGVLPPARDNQSAADFLFEQIGSNHPVVQWVTIRPDTLLEGDVTDYTLHETLVNSLVAPGQTNMANVAHFVCELVTNPKTWADWKGKLPVIINAARPSARPSKGPD